MKRLCLLLAALCAVLAVPAGDALGYVSIRVPVGHPGQALPVRWDLNNTAARPNIADRRVRYEIDDRGCADSSVFLGPINEFEAVQNSFNQWRDIRESEIDFEFAGATTNAITSAADQRNVIRWVNSNISAGVFAVTITTFNTTTGHIVDADMELNDRDYTWDTLGPDGNQGRIGRAMIENVVTHEIGHMLGLDHASNSQSSLFFQSATGVISAVSLATDDRAPIIAGYAHPTLTDPRLGRVEGTVTDGTNPQYGVEILLIDIAEGRNVVGGITEGTPGSYANGSFRIDAVPPGNYLALAWPTNKAALGAYYAQAFTAFYPVARGINVGTVGAPQLVRVGPGEVVTGVNITLPPQNQNPFEPANNTSAGAVTMASGQAAVATISPGSDQDWFKFTTTEPGQLARITVMSHAFGSSLNPTLTLYGTDGSTVLVSPVFGQPNFQESANDREVFQYGPAGLNLDARITRVMSTPGTYFFRVTSREGATTGHYLVTCEVEGADTVPDLNLSAIAAAPGIAAGGGNLSITVTPRNLFGRDLNAPAKFTVELLDITGAPQVLGTLNGSTPFNFSVPAAAASTVRRYGARINGNQISESVSVSHYGGLSAANSRVVAAERTIIANGYDRVGIRVELRDGSGNPFLDVAANVQVSTTLGTLNNGITTGTTVPAVFDAEVAAWRITLIGPGAAGTATISATANGNSVGTSATVTATAVAFGTGTQAAPDDKKKDSGGCVAGVSAAWPLWLLLIATRRRSRSGRRSATPRIQ